MDPQPEEAIDERAELRLALRTVPRYDLHDDLLRVGGVHLVVRRRGVEDARRVGTVFADDARNVHPGPVREVVLGYDAVDRTLFDCSPDTADRGDLGERRRLGGRGREGPDGVGSSGSVAVDTEDGGTHVVLFRATERPDKYTRVRTESELYRVQ